MFDIIKVQDISVLHLYGEISLLEVEYIREVFHSLKNCDHRKIVLDLANVDHVHFRAVQHWAHEAKLLQGIEGDLCLVKPSRETKNMMQFTGADQYLRDYETLADAILSFLKSPSVFSDASVMSLKDVANLTMDKETTDKKPKSSSFLVH